MDEKDLLIFLTLADTGNLTRTAEKLYLSQPTLSKRLQNMEADLGAALFLRSKQGVTLTPAGEAAREVIQRTARELNTLREQLQMRKDTICGTLRIEVSIDYSKYRLPQVLAAYTAQCPDVTLRVSTNHSRDCLRTLQDSRVHLAIVRGEYDWDEGKILLEQEPVCLIRSRENASVPLRELRYIGRDSNPEHMSMKARWLMEHKMEPDAQLNVDGLSTCGGHGQRRSWLEHRAVHLPELLRRHLGAALLRRRHPSHPLYLSALPQARERAAAGAGVHPDGLRHEQALNPIPSSKERPARPVSLFCCQTCVKGVISCVNDCPQGCAGVL